MTDSNIRTSLYAGCIAAVIGHLVFFMNLNLWELFGGPISGYQILLYPGNLSLTYFWHPIFSEEVNFWPKLFMLLSGQFTMTTVFTYITLRVFDLINLLRKNVKG